MQPGIPAVFLNQKKLKDMALVNGEGYTHASITIGLLGNTLVAGFKAISYNTAQDKQNSFGANGQPVERTRGHVNYTGSITLTQKEVMRIREAAGNRSLTEIAPFALSVSFSNGVDAIKTDVLEYVEFMDNPTASADGDAEMPVQLNLVVGGIRYGR